MRRGSQTRARNSVVAFESGSATLISVNMGQTAVMDLSILKTLGAVAGIGGLSLGVFLLLFRDIIRKSVFPQLSQRDGFRLLRLIVILIFLISAAGLGAWVFSTYTPGPKPGPAPRAKAFRILSAPNMAAVYNISGSYEVRPGQVILHVASGNMTLWSGYNQGPPMVMQTVQFGVCAATPEGSWNIYPRERSAETSIPLLGITLEKGKRDDIAAATVQVPLPITHENDYLWICAEMWTQNRTAVPGHDQTKANILAQ